MQAYAHQDNENINVNAQYLRLKNESEKLVLYNAPDSVNIFDYWAKWTIEQIAWRNLRWKGSLEVVMETVCVFLAEWITVSEREPKWEPEIPTEWIKFDIEEEQVDGYLIWIC